MNLNWGFAWPANRRMMYNRASADPEGKPWSERKKYIWWDPDQRKWTGLDIARLPARQAPGLSLARQAQGMDAIDGDSPFIMHSDGKGWLFAPSGIKDGPLPTHYEPDRVARTTTHSTPTRPTQPPTSPTSPLNPVATPPTADDDDGRRTIAIQNQNPKPKFPVVATTYRLTEHYLSGGM